MGSPRHLEADGSSSKERFVYLRSEHEHVRHIIDPAKCSGKVKAIGVSNFSEVKLEEILPTAEIIPAVNQVKYIHFTIYHFFDAKRAWVFSWNFMCITRNINSSRT